LQRLSPTSRRKGASNARRWQNVSASRHQPILVGCVLLPRKTATSEHRGDRSKEGLKFLKNKLKEVHAEPIFFQAVGESQLKARGLMEPEAELRHRYRVNADGSIGEIPLRSGCGTRYSQACKNRSIRVYASQCLPSLPFHSRWMSSSRVQPRTEDERLWNRNTLWAQPFTKRTVQDLRAGEPNA